jgi:GT2 family glycosyltransferase
MDLPDKERRAFFLPQDRPTTSARSDSVRTAKEIEAESLLFIDSDMEFEPDLYNRLKAVDADIVCGLFWAKRVPSFPTICRREPDPDNPPQFRLRTIVPDGTIQDVDACGMAATLIKKRVLDWAEYPAFQHLGALSEDFAFCLRAGDAGFNIKCDTGLKVAHRGDIAFNGQPILTHPDMGVLSFPFGEVGDGSTLRAV